MPVQKQIGKIARTVCGAARFYRRCVGLAFSGTFARVEGWTGTLSILALLAVAVLNPDTRVERIITTNAPATFFLSAFGLTVFVGLVLAPVRLHEEEIRKRQAIEALRKPRFELSLPSDGVVNISTRGSTTETAGGLRQTVTTGWVLDVVCMICQNIGETPIRNARARLMSAERIDSEGVSKPLAIFEPIELTWKKDDLKNAFAKDFAPAEICRFWIGGVRSQGQFWLYRDVADLPIEYQQIFGEAGEFRVLVQIDADDAAPVQALLRVVTAEGEKPTSGIHRGKAQLALLAVGSSTIEVANATGSPPRA